MSTSGPPGSGAGAVAPARASAPERPGLVLATLVMVASVANLNLSVANVALPEIGRAFDASQVGLDLIAVGYSLGLAASVLWFGALGDRYGRKMLLVAGLVLSVPACVVAAYAPNEQVLFLARFVGNLGGLLSVVLVAGVILAINFAPVPDKGALVLGLALVGVAAGIAFVIRQRRAPNPLYDLRVAARRTFWVAAVAGIVIFGSLMGAMYVGQQFLQNVLGYDTMEAGAAILPAAVVMVLVAPRSAQLVESHGSRVTMLTGYVFVLLGFLTMLVLWREGVSYWAVGLGYAFVGAGVGFAGTPASHSLTGSVPITRVGMASGTADLQRDLGGAVMQSIFGALLTAGYATAMTKAISSSGQSVTGATQNQLVMSFSSAVDTAQGFPKSATDAIVGAAHSRSSGGRTGRTSPASSPWSSAPLSCSSCSPGSRPSSSSSKASTGRTRRPSRAPRVDEPWRRRCPRRAPWPGPWSTARPVPRSGPCPKRGSDGRPPRRDRCLPRRGRCSILSYSGEDCPVTVVTYGTSEPRRRRTGRVA